MPPHAIRSRSQHLPNGMLIRQVPSLLRQEELAKKTEGWRINSLKRHAELNKLEQARIIDYTQF